MAREEPLGLLVVTVRRRIKQATAGLIQGLALSPQQFWTMVAIARHDGVSLRQLAAYRRMDEPTACRVVNTLVRRRLVRRSPDPTDRRRSRLTLTPVGKDTAERLLPLAGTIAEAIESSLSAAERHAVVSGLQKVLAGLDRFDAEHGRRPGGGAAPA